MLEFVMPVAHCCDGDKPNVFISVNVSINRTVLKNSAAATLLLVQQYCGKTVIGCDLTPDM